MVTIKEQMFVIQYLSLDEDGNIGQIYIDIFGKEEGKDDIRTYITKAKKLIKTARCQEELARLQAKDTIDTGNPEDVKGFIMKELIGLYSKSSTIVPVYSKSGELLEGRSEYMDSSVVKSSMDMLGRSVGLFKEVVESKEEIITVSVDGVEVTDNGKVKNEDKSLSSNGNSGINVAN